MSPRRPEAIRTLNILNRDYFSDAKLTEAVRAVWNSLEVDGVWIVGRTISESPRTHHASVLRKTRNGFDVAARYLHGSEIEDLALAFLPDK